MTRLLPLGVLALLISGPTSLEAQDTEWNRYTLENLGGVYPRMEVADACEAAGISASDFEADVSLALMDAEVGVLTREEMLEHPALPELRITISCAAGSNGARGALAYSGVLRVQQSAQMLRDTQITLPEAVTWYSSRIGVASEGAVAGAVAEELTGQVQAFASAWTEIHSEEGGA